MAETPTSGPPSLGQIAAPDAFKDDLILLGKYQEFSAETLRIALLGLSGLGALVYSSFVAKPEAVTHFGWPRLVEGGIATASFVFGVAAAAALLHRYFSSDGMADELRTLRLEKAGRKDDANAEREGQKRSYKLALTSLRVGTVSLAVGGLAFAGALFGIVIR